jgi:hypothetical protein
MHKSSPLGAIALAIFGFCSSATARPSSAQCQLSIDGKSYVSGQCIVNLDPDGSFTLNAETPGVPPTYFAYVDVAQDGSGSASWNRDKGSAHAWASLGVVIHRGNCWINARARICISR